MTIKPDRTEFEKPQKEKKVAYLKRKQEEREERRRLEEDLYEFEKELDVTPPKF